MLRMMHGRSALLSPYILAKATRAALPALAYLKHPLLLSSTVARLAVSSNVKQGSSPISCCWYSQRARCSLCFRSRPRRPNAWARNANRARLWDVEEFYDVDSIKARRLVKDGTLEYLIHWKGYDNDHDTREPLKHLSGIEPELSAFEAKEKKDQQEWAKSKAEAAAAN